MMVVCLCVISGHVQECREDAERKGQFEQVIDSQRRHIDENR